MDEPTVALLRKAFREHYFKSAKTIEMPTNMEEREFGYVLFDRTMIRHLSFVTPGELVAELVRQAPSSVYCSNARYSNPRLSMDDKGWLAAELIFDIDADMIPTSCKSKHNRWFCAGCRKWGRAPRPQICPSCQRPDPKEMRWTCTECLAATKTHVYRLIDFLTRDFGVSDGKIRVHFSGSRGYHVQVYDERFDPFDSRARAQVANYILGTSLIMQKEWMNSKHAEGARGWAERVNRSTDATTEPSTKSRSVRSTQKLLNEAIQVNAAIIDKSVTTDIHRVFRMPGTLHGSSGLLKMRVTTLDDFNPLYDSVVLGDEGVKLFIDIAPRFELKGETFGPFNSASITLPMYAAVFLLAKDLAKVQVL